MLMLIRCCHGTSSQNSYIRIFQLLSPANQCVHLEGCGVRVEVEDISMSEQESLPKTITL